MTIVKLFSNHDVVLISNLFKFECRIIFGKAIVMFLYVVFCAYIPSLFPLLHKYANVSCLALNSSCCHRETMHLHLRDSERVETSQMTVYCSRSEHLL